MYGFETTVLLPLHAACSAWCGPAFYPADIRTALAAVPGPRVLVTTPLQLRALLSAATALPALDRIISATSPLDEAMAAAAEQAWQTTVSEIFGATEVGSIASRRTTAGPEWMPYPNIRLLARGEQLLVQASGTDDSVLDDIVALLPDGRFRLVGRRSDVVKLGGRRASLAGLNRELVAVAGVEDGVFVPPDAGDHQAAARMMAYVVAPGAEAAFILAALRERIDPVFLPRRIVHVDRLPRNELGKLPVAALHALRKAS
jgi:acyl-coenzyme A synthetase/AMP-(fatty) acid ligase